MEEEAQKRNTDCVYFLASPLTCKKGSECEYRHSESARINPRHCWYWLSGNCLNPHCAFRHPPLEVNPTASGNDSSPASGNANKNGVPCYYFFQGYCAKGDKCSFMHGSPFGGKPGVSASQKTTKVSSTGTEPQSMEKKDTNGTDNGTAKFTSVKNTTIEVQLPIEAKFIPETGPPLYHVKTDRHTPELSLPELEYALESVRDPPANDINFVTRSEIHQDDRTDEWLENDMENEEWLEESSPGFDVLVDDGPEQLGYQDGADYLSSFDMEPGRESFRGRERIIPTTDELTQFDYEGMHDELGYIEGRSQYAHMSYDPHEELALQCSYDHGIRHKRKGFDGRDTDGAVLYERNGLSERHSRRFEKADLRQRLTKRRRSDRTQIGDKSTRRSHSDARPANFHHGHRQRSNGQIYHHDAAARRQQGYRHNNMPMPSRMLSTIGCYPRESFNGVDPDFEGGPEKLQVRSSVGRHGSVENFRSRHKERERGRFHVASTPSESSGFRRPVSKTETGKNDIDFARPKSLEQIKEEKRKAALLSNGFKVCDTTKEPKSAEQSALHGSQIVVSKNQPLNNLTGEERKISLGKVIVNEPNKLPSFEGPKPLSALLKEKQKSNDDSAGITLSKGTGELSQRLESNGNSKISGIDVKTNVFSLCLQNKVEEKLFAQGGRQTCEPNADVLERRPPYLSSKFEQGDSSVQNNGYLHVHGVSNSPTIEEDSSMEPLKIENGRKSIHHKLEPDEDDFAMEEDEDDDFAKRLGGFFS